MKAVNLVADFEALSANGDVFFTLNTVTLCILVFFESHPKAKVFFKGASEKRTRVYSKLILRNWNKLVPRFAIFGYLDGRWMNFAQDQNYSAILFTQNT
ncbi:MAG: hypothetical protein V4543_13950 [Bacteroidota bacterium]